jgi:outer membrane protein assembly factor BamB
MKQPNRLTVTRTRALGWLLIGCVVFSASATLGRPWPRFRGPNGQGISQDKDIPVKWTEGDYNWKVELPGGGHSSPVVWADRLFITSADQKSGRGILLALRVSDGGVLWRREYELTSYRMNALNSYATTTPALDAEHVYTLWPTAKQTVLVALDHKGNPVWKRPFEGYHCQHGAGSSPVVFEDIVAFTLEHEGGDSSGQSMWIGVDRATGQIRWELPRQNSPKTSYSTPCFYRPDTGKPQLIFTSRAHGVTAVDPQTGKVVWEVGSAFPNRVVSSPVIADGLIIGTCGDGGSGKRLIAIRPGTPDEPSLAGQAYTIDDSSTPYVPTSVATDGLLFTFHDRGDVSCLRSATGQMLWREKPAGRYYGSPVWVDGKLYCISIDGEVVVIKAAPTYELLAVNPLGQKSHATPAVADGRMFLRTNSRLISIGPGK